MKGRTNTLKYVVNYGLLLGWALVIFILSSEGSSASTGRSDVVVSVLQGLGAGIPVDTLTVIARKGAHIAAYFVLGLLVFNVVRMYSLAARKAIVLAMLIVVGYAASDELHQRFVPGRSSELRDVLIDTTAGLVAVGAYAFVDMRRGAGKTTVNKR